MSVNPLTHLSNTICYVDKPAPGQAEKTRLEPDKRANGVEAGADAPSSSLGNPVLGIDAPKATEPGPSINGNGQVLGRILNAIA